MFLETEKLQKAPQESWPSAVKMILSAMDAAPKPFEDQRKTERMAFHVRAELTLFADGEFAQPWTLYTRDVDPRGCGFIAPDRLPLGYGGFVELCCPNGKKVRIACTLYRCREVVPGWYEGALYFNREQWMFTPDQCTLSDESTDYGTFV